MKPDDKEIDALVKALSSRHGLRFDELVRQAEKLANYIKGLDDFESVEPDALVDVPHVGRVIVDAVLQVGHSYEGQVRKRVEYIKTTMKQLQYLVSCASLRNWELMNCSIGIAPPWRWICLVLVFFLRTVELKHIPN